MAVSYGQSKVERINPPTVNERTVGRSGGLFVLVDLHLLSTGLGDGSGDEAQAIRSTGSGGHGPQRDLGRDHFNSRNDGGRKRLLGQIW